MHSETNPAFKRRKTRCVWVGKVRVGGDAPVIVQSMTSTDTRDVKSTVRQIKRLERAGCEIVRVAVPDAEAAAAISEIKARISVPIVADIHFHYRLAIKAIEAGADGIRINPGNLERDRIKEVVAAAKRKGACIRIGVNAGSLQKEFLEKYGGPTADALVESAMQNIALLEEEGFHEIKLSLKASHVPTMIDAYRSISEKTDYPLHLGVTEAGSLLSSAIKSSIGIGLLLSDGIGDTIRISVTGDPVQEMSIAYGILRTLDIRKVGPEIIACPTCGRCEIDVVRLVGKIEKKLAGTKDYFRIALMGCVVNGPGEAAEADIGIAGGKGYGMLFKKGKLLRKVREEEFVDQLLDEIKKMNLGKWGK
jgi:(E)-4-hydroxy-3-methylbut-2-enyl-diphosphate synthase